MTQESGGVWFFIPATPKHQFMVSHRKVILNRTVSKLSGDNCIDIPIQCITIAPLGRRPRGSIGDYQVCVCVRACVRACVCVCV